MTTKHKTIDEIFEGIKDVINKEFDNAFDEWEKEIEPKIREVEKTIKHPMFTLAFLDLNDLSISYHKKSFREFFRWFGKRVVLVRPVKMQMGTVVPQYFGNTYGGTYETKL